MAKNLVIVESPAKVKTIRKFLGSNYEVMASQGHVRDFPKSQLGIDTEHGYTPKYITIRGKGDILASLRKSVKKADKIYLATDPDREGEAISWHLSKALNLDDKKFYRITFNEITKSAVKESLKHARKIDMDLVNAQQARRMMDRMVGYRISPLLWAKIKRGLSAGRVQSVALRIICDREDEINAFIPEEYWTVDAKLQLKGEKKPLIAHFTGKGEEKTQLHSAADVNALHESLQNAKYKVEDVKRGTRTKKAPLPYTTSTMQQDAGRKLNYTTQKTMRIAQQLYEGVDIKGKGTVALISYLRTDSTRVSDEAQEMAKRFITDAYGDRYAARPTKAAQGKNKIQDAHEAIRPSDVEITPSSVKDFISKDQYRLYQLIWKRFVASRMTDAQFETTSVTISADEYRFHVAASKPAFDGFMSVYTIDDEEKEESNVLLNTIDKKAELSLIELEEKQHFTQPPAHFTEASLVSAMEEFGIGRPSTYSPTITTIQARHYVTKENKNLYVTELGEVVNNMMKDAFPSIVDTNFTANLEMLLDRVEDGEVDWKTIIENFYPDLDAAVSKAEAELEQVTIRDEESDEVCEQCGRTMVIKYGPHGKFLACPGFPECRNTKPYLEKIGIKCPECGKDIVIRKTKKGRKFYGCESGTDCSFMSWNRPVATPCEKCGSLMVIKGNKLVCNNEACGFMTERKKNEDE
ncbi:MAG: type I DNA topoisomerase [Lachnospiraceae bacterium]|nr:type I DNA topoisomerase [Lachnospiraceae bacterium]